MSVDKRTSFQNNSFSSPKRDILPLNNKLGSPNRTMTLSSNYMNQNNTFLLKSIQ